MLKYACALLKKVKERVKTLNLTVKTKICGGYMSDTVHEVVRLFQTQVHPLSHKLVEMLNEHYMHRTERRGCGYTQATRVLADFINFKREEKNWSDLKIFEDFNIKNLKKIMDSKKIYELEFDSWRWLHQNNSIQQFFKTATENDFYHLLKYEVDWQEKLEKLHHLLELEESKVICRLLEDIILPKTKESTGLAEIESLLEKPKVGSCPMAENFFLKIAYGSVLRQGQINIFVDDINEPLFLEKINMGDNHSCISLKPLLMNGVVVPEGALFSANYHIENIKNKRPNKQFKGYVIHYKEITGLWFLRLTTLAISPENRKRAFTTHFEQQVLNGLYSPATTQLSQLRDVAIAQL